MYITDMGYGLNSTGSEQDIMAGFCDIIKKKLLGSKVTGLLGSIK